MCVVIPLRKKPPGKPEGLTIEVIVERLFTIYKQLDGLFFHVPSFE